MNKLINAPKNDPKYFIELNGEKFADPRAARSLLALMNMHAVIGGAACHWGGPSALAEVLSVIHNRMFKYSDWFNHFNFVNDIGHAENGIYAFKALYAYGDMTFNDVKKFRSLGSPLTGHGESHLYPEGVLMSNGPLGSSVPQAQGLAMSDKMLKNHRTTISLLSDGGAMEGEAKEALTAIPGLHKKGLINPFLLIISDNDTKLSGRMGDAYSMKPSFESLESLGWNIVRVEEGNDLKSCIKGFDSSLHASRLAPTALILKTIKGKGVSSTEKSVSGGHGYPLKAYSAELSEFLKEIWGYQCPAEFLEWAEKLSKKPETTSAKVKKEKMQVGVSKALIELKNAGLPIVSLSSDLQGSTGLKPFHQEFPQFSIDLGIAESNMVGAAAGFSKNGFIPVVDTFAAFGVTKGNLPLIMASLSQSPMICIFSHAGFQDAADGASHQSLTYFSALSSIPDVEIIAPANSHDTYELLKWACQKQFEDKKTNHAKSYVFILGRETFPPSFHAEDVDILKDQTLKLGKDALIVASGALVHEAFQASVKLQNKGLEVGVINHRHLSSIDPKSYETLLNSHNQKIIIAEDHQRANGIGSYLVAELKQAGLEFKSMSLGVKGVFGQSAYKAGELYSKHGLDYLGIADSAEKFINS